MLVAMNIGKEHTKSQDQISELKGGTQEHRRGRHGQKATRASFEEGRRIYLAWEIRQASNQSLVGEGLQH